LVLGITGVLLEQFYNPASPEAYGTVVFIISQVLAGRFLRNTHYWAAQFAAVIVGLHMIRVLVAGAYKKPREMQWLVGVGLLLTVGAFLFTGTTLKWDQEAVEGLAHNIELAQGLGALGYWFLPTFAEDVPLLTRLFVAHASILPVIGVMLLGVHFFLIRVLGISSPNGEGSRIVEMVPFSEHVKKVLSYSAVLVAVLLVLAAIVSAPLGPEAVVGVEVTKPPWLLLWIYGIEDLFGLQVVPLVTGFVAVVLVMIPFLDKTTTTDPRRRKLVLALVIVGYIVIFGLTAYAAIKPPEAHLMP
jgi:ubiquinol-cytochrome c reductase cytochrome b subunit